MKLIEMSMTFNNRTPGIVVIPDAADLTARYVVLIQQTNLGNERVVDPAQSGDASQSTSGAGSNASLLAGTY